MKYFRHNFYKPFLSRNVPTHINTENLSYVYGFYVANRTDIFLHKTNDSKIDSHYTQKPTTKAHELYFLFRYSACYCGQCHIPQCAQCPFSLPLTHNLPALLTLHVRLQEWTFS